MASLIESEAVFSGRLKACGLEAYASEFHRRGWRTLSTFAFSSSWAPGSGDDQSFIDSVVKPVLRDPAHADVPKMRKLYFEAYTMVAADLKSKLDHGPDADGQKEEAGAGGAQSKVAGGEASIPPHDLHRAVGASAPGDCTARDPNQGAGVEECEDRRDD